MKKKLIFLCISLFNCQSVLGYHLPHVNLGFTNILDGGPIISKPGWYLTQYSQYYTSNKFLDSQGNIIQGTYPSKFRVYDNVTQIVYQSDKKYLFEGRGGLYFALPYVFYSHIRKNLPGFKNSVAGFGDVIIGAFLQWDPIIFNNRPIFVHRFELDISLPSGKNDQPNVAINPGNHFLYINPYWAGTFFFTEKMATSWRLHYLWNKRNSATHIKAGDAIHMNFSLEFNFKPNLWLAMNGYFLQQLKNSELLEQEIPLSKEKIFAIGPGFLYQPMEGFDFFGHLYFEMGVRNRSQGINFILRVVKYFK